MMFLLRIATLILFLISIFLVESSFFSQGGRLLIVVLTEIIGLTLIFFERYKLKTHYRILLPNAAILLAVLTIFLIKAYLSH